MKKTLTLALILVLALGLFSCNDTPPTPDPTLEVPATMTAEQYTEVTVPATVKDGEGTVAFTVDGSGVLEQSGNGFYAVKPGTAVVTARVEALNLEATCTVTVTEAAVQPVFTQSDTLTLFCGTGDTLDDELTLNDAVFTRATVSFSTEGSVLTVNEDGSVLALAAGKQTVVMTARIGDYVVAQKSVEITVAEYGAVESGIERNEIALTVTTENEGSLNSYTLSDVTVQINFIDVVNPVLAFESDNTSVAVVDASGVITAVGTGSAKIRVSYVSETGNTYDTLINVVVDKETVKKDIGFFVKAQDGNAAIDLSGKSIDLSAVTAITCDGNDYGFSVAGDVLTVNSAPTGDRIYRLTTPTVDYLIDGCVYNEVISNKDELLAYAANFNSLYGYYVLTADIDMGGATFAPSGWQRSVLDGRGHTVSNVVLTQGFAPDQNEAGKLCNIQLVNVLMDASKDPRYGIIGFQCCGSVENVYIEGRIINAGATAQIIAGGSFNASVFRNIVANVVIDGATTAYTIGGNYEQGGATIENVYVVSNITPSDAFALSANSVDGLLALTDFAALDGWNKPEGKLPELAPHDIAAIYEVRGYRTAGETLTIVTTDKDAVITLGGEYTGVTLSGFTLTVSEEFYGDLDVIFTSPKLNEALTVSLDIARKKAVETKEVNFLVKGDASPANDKRLSGTVNIDLSGKDIDLSTVLGVSVNRTPIAFTYSGDVLTLTDAPQGIITICLEYEDKEVYFDGCIYTTGIATKDDLIAYAGAFNGIYGYTVLLNDIDMEGATFAPDGWQRGVLDGRGHTVSNVVLTKGFAPDQNEAGKLCNIQIVNALMDASADARYGIIGFQCCGSVENVYIEGRIINAGDTAQIIAGGAFNASTFRNIVANVVIDGATAAYTIGGAYSQGGETIENVFVVSNVDLSDGLAISAGTVDGLLALTDFAALDSWKKEDGKLPTIADYSIAPMYVVRGVAKLGNTLTVFTTDPFASWALASAVEGITVNGNEITIGEAAAGKTFTVVFSSPKLAENIEVSNTVFNEVTGSAANAYYVVSDGKLGIDLSTVTPTIAPANIVKVMVNGVACDFQTSESVLSVTSTATGKVTVTVIDDANMVSFEVLAADKVLSTKDDFKTFLSESGMTGTYVVLANDIDIGGDEWTNWCQNFSGTFDGLGHKVSNFSLGYGISYKVKGATFKNFTFDNYGFNGSHAMFGGWYHEGITVENAVINAHFTTAYDAAGSGLLIWKVNPGTNAFKNLTINLTAFAGDEDTPVILAVNDAYYTIDLTGTTITYNGTLVKPSDEMYGDLLIGAGKMLDKNDMEQATYAGGYVLLSEGTVTLDLSKLDKTVSGVKSLKVNGADASFTEGEGTLTLTGMTEGAKSITATLDGKIVSFDIAFATQTISNKAELLAYGSGMNSIYGYIVLTADIDMENTTYTPDGWQRSVIDGLGHTISNIVLTKGFVGDQNEAGAVKNVNFAGLILNAEDPKYGIIGFQCCGTTENVTVSGTINSVGGAQNLISGCNFSGSKFMNISGNVTVAGATSTVAVGGNYVQGTGGVVSNINVTATILEAASYSDAYVVLSGDAITLDLSKFDKAVSGVQAVTVGGIACTFTEGEGTLTISGVAAGEKKVTIALADKTVYFDLIIADKVLSTKDDFKTFLSESGMTGAYVVLANDIDIGGDEWTNWCQNFSGTFNGLGHKVSNFSLGYGISYKVKGATFKNFTFDNYGFNGSHAMFGGWYHEGITVENAVINAHFTTAYDATGSGLLIWKVNPGTNAFKNLTINLTAFAGDEDTPVILAVNDAYYTIDLTGTTITYNGTLVKPSDEMYGDLLIGAGKMLDKNDMEQATYAGGYVLLSEDTVTLDLSKLDKTVSGVKSLKVNGADASFTEGEGTLTLTGMTEGAKSITATLDGKIVSFDIAFATQTISNKAELLAYGSGMNSIYGYIVLTADIDMENTTYTPDGWQRSVIDGLGHTISNIVLTKGFVGDQNEAGAVKNVNFTGLILNAEDPKYGIIGFQCCGTTENVTVSGTINSVGGAQNLISGCNFSGSKFMNISGNVTVAGATSTVAIGGNYVQGTGGVVSNINVTATILEAASYSDAYVVLSDDAITLDLSKFDKAVSGVQAVTVGGIACTFTEGEGTLTISGAAAGEKKVTIALADKTVYFDLIIADKVLSTKDDFKTFFSESGMTGTYVVLANDIDIGGDEWTNWNQTYSGTFNGMGHTVSNFTMGWGITYKCLGATFKNFTFDNYGCPAENGIFGGWYHEGITVDNAVINAHFTAAYTAERGLLITKIGPGAFKFTNLTINVTAYEGDEDTAVLLIYNEAYYSADLTGTTITYTGTLVKPDDICYGGKLTGNPTILDKNDAE